MNEQGLAGQAAQEQAMQQIMQIVQLLQQGMSPEQLLQQGVPQELIAEAMRVLEEQAVATGPQIMPGQEGMSAGMM